MTSATVVLLMLLGQTKSPALEGVWGASRNFGPAVRGTLDIARSQGKWRAKIAQYDLDVVAEADRLSFELPADQGSFAGRLSKDGSIRGHWLQPPTVNDGGKFALPVLLQRKGKDRWQGEVVPLEDEFTLYLVFSQADDGVTKAWIRNPNRNIGMWWRVDRVKRTGNDVELIGKFLGRGNEMVLGAGKYHPDDGRLSIYFRNRGGTYDFKPIDELVPGFYARGKDPAPYQYRPPAQEEDGWKVGTLAEVGMTKEPLAELIETISAAPKSLHDVDIHGILIARHGKLVFEEYFHGFHRKKPHETRSASKVLAATLVGAAKLATSTLVYELLYQGALPADLDPRKKVMTVEHLLTMASGYDCDDWDGTRPGSEDKLLDEMPDPNFYRYTLQLPMELEPGKQAIYCSINPNLVGAVVAAAAKKPVTELFHDLIAEPMQMRHYYLGLQPTGEPYLGGGAKFLPRDFMKLGQMMLDGGVWNGKRILSKEFAKLAGSPLVTLRGQKEGKYGYLWWTTEYAHRGKTVHAYFASGNGGQVVVVVPELDLVIACYGGNYNDRGGWIMVREHIPKLILPAVVGG